MKHFSKDYLISNGPQCLCTHHTYQMEHWTPYAVYTFRFIVKCCNTCCWYYSFSFDKIYNTFESIGNQPKIALAERTQKLKSVDGSTKSNICVFFLFAYFIKHKYVWILNDNRWLIPVSHFSHMLKYSNAL